MDNSFQPSTITVPVGTTITWNNHDNRDEIIAAADGSFDSGNISNGHEFRYTFLDSGTYEYYSKADPSMRGEVIVSSANGIPPKAQAQQEKSTKNVSAASTPNASTAPSEAAQPASGPAGVTIWLTAKNIAFNTSAITVPAGAKVNVNFDNQDSGIPHNFAVYDTSAGGQAIFQGKIITGPTTTIYSFTAPSQPGTYQFRCDVHPTQMTGQFVVKPSSASGNAPISASASASSMSQMNVSEMNISQMNIPKSEILTPARISTTSPVPSTRVTIDLLAKDINFDKNKLTVIAGSQVTINFVNLDRGVPHNFALYTNSEAEIAIYQGAIIIGPSQITYTFDAPVDVGTYFFRCDVHPKAMTGQFFVVSSDLLPSEQTSTASQSQPGMNMTMNMPSSAAPAANTNTTSKNQPGVGAQTVSVDLTAQNIAFDKNIITVPAGATVTINFNNRDSGVPHNFAAYTDSAAATAIFKGEIITGPGKTTYTFIAPVKTGEYFFRCDVHPTTMTGKLMVQPAGASAQQTNSSSQA